MLKIYLDNCCYSRPFDDLTQEKVNLEAKAIEVILGKHIRKELEIYKSMAIDFEMSKIKDPDKKMQVEDLYNALNLVEINYSQKIRERAIELREYNIKDMDALHIAFAESIVIDYLITTDKPMLSSSKRVDLKSKVINPIEFIMEVV